MMTDYISRDVARKALADAGLINYNDTGDHNGLIHAINVINAIPAADVVEVVRCKDCKFAHLTYDGDCKYCDNERDDDDFHITVYYSGDHFCSYGERREDG